uniref:C-type lectin domain-containing protein n=1 Tax=Panagrellus redivivus TaxID=6233 RepID=A0A7E4V2U3_PANRE
MLMITRKTEQSPLFKRWRPPCSRFFNSSSFLSCISSCNGVALLKSSSNIVEATSACGEGWFYSLELNECYYVSRNDSTFENAKSFCQDISGNLVSIYSDVEYYTVSAFIEQQDFVEPFWIGLRTYVYSPYFRWLDNTNANYTHWINGTAPSHNDSNACFAWSKTFANNGWLQVDCQNPLPYICKRHAKVDTDVYINGTSGSIQSPNYPAPYYANSISQYTIEVPEGYVIDLFFDFIAIDYYSKIYVIDNGTVIDTITSQSRRHSVESYSNELLVEFHASKEGNERYIGWTANFNAFVPITMQGSFNSPNYPNNYDIFESITKLVHVPESYGIIINVWDFISEQNYDYLSITTDEGRLLYLTGTNVVTPITIRTNSTEATLFWQSDQSNVYRGFNLTYVADPNW